MLNICPFCETNGLKEVSYSERVKAGRKTLEVAGLSKMTCIECGSESIPLDMYERNAVVVQNALSQSRGAVTRGVLRHLREIWGVSQKEASAIFGAGPNSFAKWESGAGQLSTPAALLVQCALKFPPVMKYLADLANVCTARARRAEVELAETEWDSAYSYATAEQSTNVIAFRPRVGKPYSTRDWETGDYESLKFTASDGVYLQIRVAA